jgi:hypothetical protein
MSINRIPGIKLIGQIKILRLTEPEEAVDAASIMRSRNAQCCHSSMIRSVAHPRSARDEIFHRSLRCSASGYVIGDPTGRTATESATLSAAASLPVPCSARTSGRPGTSVTTALALRLVLRARCSTLPNRRLSRGPPAASRGSTSLLVRREEGNEPAVTSRDGVRSVVG